MFSNGSAPTGLIGAIYVDTSDSNKLKYHNGTSFIALGTSNADGDITRVNITAGNGLSGTSVDTTSGVHTQTLTVGQGTGITINPSNVAVSAAQTGITSIYNTSLQIGGASNANHIGFSAGKILFTVGNQAQLQLHDGSLRPSTNNDIDLGTSSAKFKDAFFDGTVTSDAFTGPLTGDVTGNADTATALETARNIGGVSFDGTANINLPGVNTAGNQDTTGNAALLRLLKLQELLVV